MKGPIATIANNNNNGTANPTIGNGIVNNNNNNNKTVVENNPTQVVDLISNPLFKVEQALEKKSRNLEKRRSKLQQIKLGHANGEKLTEEQQDALLKMPEVDQQSEFIKEMQKLVAQQTRQYQRANRQRMDTINKKNNELNLELLKTYFKFQEVLAVVSDKSLSYDFLQGKSGPTLTQDELDLFSKFNDELSPKNKGREEWNNQILGLSKSFYKICTGSVEKIENNLTGEYLKGLLEKVLESPIYQSYQQQSSQQQQQYVEESYESSVNDFQAENDGGDPNEKVQNVKIVEILEKAEQIVNVGDNVVDKVVISDTVVVVENSPNYVSLPVTPPGTPLESPTIGQEDQQQQHPLTIDSNVETMITTATAAAKDVNINSCKPAESKEFGNSTMNGVGEEIGDTINSQNSPKNQQQGNRNNRNRQNGGHQRRYYNRTNGSNVGGPIVGGGGGSSGNRGPRPNSASNSTRAATTNKVVVDSEGFEINVRRNYNNLRTNSNSNRRSNTNNNSNNNNFVGVDGGGQQQQQYPPRNNNNNTNYRRYNNNNRQSNVDGGANRPQRNNYNNDNSRSGNNNNNNGPRSGGGGGNRQQQQQNNDHEPREYGFHFAR